MESVRVWAWWMDGWDWIGWMPNASIHPTSMNGMLLFSSLLFSSLLFSSLLFHIILLLLLFSSVIPKGCGRSSTPMPTDHPMKHSSSLHSCVTEHHVCSPRSCTIPFLKPRMQITLSWSPKFNPLGASCVQFTRSILVINHCIVLPCSFHSHWKHRVLVLLVWTKEGFACFGPSNHWVRLVRGEV